jgi:ABC-type phosphate transport system substrate-binding protein
LFVVCSCANVSSGSVGHCRGNAGLQRCWNVCPIVTYTWLICYKKYPDKVKLQAMQDLVRFGLTEGQKDAETLGCISLPSNVVEKATGAIQNLTAP